MSTTNYSDIELGKVKLSIQDFITACEFLNVDPMIIIDDSNTITVTLTPAEASALQKLVITLEKKQ